MYGILQSLNDTVSQIEYFHQYGACLKMDSNFKLFVESILNSYDSSVSEIFRFRLEPSIP